MGRKIVEMLEASATDQPPGKEYREKTIFEQGLHRGGEPKPQEDLVAQRSHTLT
jgi:hypothetical protein